MKLLILAISLLSANAYSIGYKDVTSNFIIKTTSNDNSRVFYNCDSVEAHTKSVLKVLGAKNIKVRCSGGISRTGMSTAAFIKTSYNVLSVEANDDNLSTMVMSERIRSRSNCHLMHAIVKNVKENFVLTNLSTRRCFRASDRANITFDVLKEI